MANGPSRVVELPSLRSVLPSVEPTRPPSVAAQAIETDDGWIIDFIGPSGLRWTLSPAEAEATARAWLAAVDDVP